MNSSERNHETEPNQLNDVQRLIISELRAAKRAEVIACAFCDNDSPASLEDALIKGWTSLQIDDGITWNYLGVCPACKDQGDTE